PARKFRGRAKAYRAGDVFGARPPTALLMASKENRLQPGGLANIKRPGALGAIDLMAAEGIEIDSQFSYIDRNLAGRLHAVAVHQHSCAVGGGRDLLNGLHR